MELRRFPCQIPALRVIDPTPTLTLIYRSENEFLAASWNTQGHRHLVLAKLHRDTILDKKLGRHAVDLLESDCDAVAHGRTGKADEDKTSE